MLNNDCLRIIFSYSELNNLDGILGRLMKDATPQLRKRFIELNSKNLRNSGLSRSCILSSLPYYKSFYLMSDDTLALDLLSNFSLKDLLQLKKNNHPLVISLLNFQDISITLDEILKSEIDNFYSPSPLRHLCNSIGFELTKDNLNIIRNILSSVFTTHPEFFNIIVRANRHGYHCIRIINTCLDNGLIDLLIFYCITIDNDLLPILSMHQKLKEFFPNYECLKKIDIESDDHISCFIDFVICCEDLEALSYRDRHLLRIWSYLLFYRAKSEVLGWSSKKEEEILSQREKDHEIIKNIKLCFTSKSLRNLKLNRGRISFL